MCFELLWEITSFVNGFVRQLIKLNGVVRQPMKFNGVVRD